jgi:hypothetical protein
MNEIDQARRAHDEASRLMYEANRASNEAHKAERAASRRLAELLGAPRPEQFVRYRAGTMKNAIRVGVVVTSEYRSDFGLAQAKRNRYTVNVKRVSVHTGEFLRGRLRGLRDEVKREDLDVVGDTFDAVKP